MIQSGSYPVQAFAKGSDFRLVQSSATDLQSSISGQTFTNMLSVSNNVLAVHTPGFRVDGAQTNKGTIYIGNATQSAIANTGAEQLSLYSQPGSLSATLFTGNLRVFNNAANGGRVSLRAGDSSTVVNVVSWTNGVQITDSGSGFGNAYASNSVLVGASIFRSNVVSAAAVAAAITNGDFGTITLSNAYQCFWMSNNVMNWKKLAP